MKRRKRYPANFFKSVPDEVAQIGAFLFDNKMGMHVDWKVGGLVFGLRSCGVDQEDVDNVSLMCKWFKGAETSVGESNNVVYHWFNIQKGMGIAFVHRILPFLDDRKHIAEEMIKLAESGYSGFRSSFDGDIGVYREELIKSIRLEWKQVNAQQKEERQ